jgi:hypothetical protein
MLTPESGCYAMSACGVPTSARGFRHAFSQAEAAYLAAQDQIAAIQTNCFDVNYADMVVSIFIWQTAMMQLGGGGV